MTAASIGPFKLARAIASNGMGTVHEAHDVEGRSVAIRVLPADGLPTGADERERLRRMALAAAELQHPGIVELLDFGWEDDTPYAATAFVEGETLAHYLARVGRLPALQGLSLALQLLAALAAAHERGLVHSALNPQHVLMGRNGQLKIDGFGWVAAAASAGRRPGVFDAPAYMAPEQILGQPADCRTDLYSATVLAYELLAGSWPYQAHAVPRPPRALRRELPVALDAVFERAQARNPEARYPNAAELAAALQGAFGEPAREHAAIVPVRPAGVAVAEPPSRAVEQAPAAAVALDEEADAPTPAGRHRVAMAVVAGLAAAVVLGGMFVGVESARDRGEPQQRSAAPSPAPVAAAPTPAPALAPAPAPEPVSAPAPMPVAVAPAPPPDRPAAEAVPAVAPIQATKRPERTPAPAAAPVRAKTRPAESRPRKTEERPADRGVREIVVPEAIEARSREGVDAPAPRARETAERRTPREPDNERRPRTTAVMAAPPSPSPLNVCRQEYSMARDLCVAYQCATSEYRHHAVCVRMHADAVVRHKLDSRNGP